MGALIKEETAITDEVLNAIAHIPTRSLRSVVDNGFFKKLSDRDFMRIAAWLARKSYEEGGWQEHYFDPMKEYFAQRKRPRTRRTAKGVARKTKAKRTRAGRTAGPALRRAKPKRARTATRAKAKRAASKARRTVGKKAPKRAAAAKAARPRAKKTRSKTARGKRR